MKSKVDYFHISKGDEVTVTERVEEIDGEKVNPPFNKCVHTDGSDPAIHYLYDFEIE